MGRRPPDVRQPPGSSRDHVARRQQAGDPATFPGRTIPVPLCWLPAPYAQPVPVQSPEALGPEGDDTARWRGRSPISFLIAAVT